MRMLIVSNLAILTLSVGYWFPGSEDCHAAVPGKINYQGKLTDASGKPIFMKREVHSQKFSLSIKEQRFYEKLTEYLKEGFMAGKDIFYHRDKNGVEIDFVIEKDGEVFLVAHFRAEYSLFPKMEATVFGEFIRGNCPVGSRG